MAFGITPQQVEGGPVLLGPPIQDAGVVRYAYAYDPLVPRCMSLACEHWGHCRPDANGNYPADCSTGALAFGNDMASPLGPPVTAPIGQEANASSAAPFSIVEMFKKMDTTSLLIIGAAAYFMFFRKGR